MGFPKLSISDEWKNLNQFKKLNENMKFRNMLKRWMNYKVKVVSHVNMHEEIESEHVRFTLLKKLS